MKKCFTLILLSSVLMHYSYSDSIKEAWENDTENRNAYFNKIDAEVRGEYSDKFWSFLESSDFSGLIQKQEAIAFDKGYNQTFYISGYVRGFIESSSIDNVDNTGMVQGDDRFYTKWIIRNHENYGYLAGREAGHTYGKNIAGKLRAAANLKKHQYIVDFENDLDE